MVGDAVKVNEVSREAFGDDGAVLMCGEQSIEGARIGVDRGDQISSACAAEVRMLEKLWSSGLSCVAARDDQAEKQQAGPREDACRKSSEHGYSVGGLSPAVKKFEDCLLSESPEKGAVECCRFFTAWLFQALQR